MAINTDSLLSISLNGVEYDKIGLSKPLNNYTFDELFNSVYCSAGSNLIYHVASGGDITYYDYQDNPDNGHIPVKLTPAGRNRSAIYFPNDNPLNMPDGLYFRVIWLQRTSSGYNSYIDKNNIGQFYKAITMMTTSHYVWECDPPTKQNNNYGADSWDNENNLYCSEGGTLYYYDDIKSATPTRIAVNNVVPAIIFKFNGHNYLLPYRQKMSYFFTKENTHSEISYNPKTAKFCYDYDNSNPIAFPLTTEQIYDYFNSSTGEFSSPFTEGSYISLGNGAYPSSAFSDTVKEHIMSIYAFGGGTSYNSYFGFDVYNYFKTKNECIKFWTLGGLYIKADKIYKPIIKDGYVSDFTEDLDKDSDIDNYRSEMVHDVPENKPSGGGGTDDIEPMIYGDDVGLYGAVTYYTMTYVQLSSFMDALETATIEHPDIASGFVSAYYIPKVLNDITHSTEMPIRVKGVELSGATGGKTILQKSLVLGTIYVPVRHNNAFDTLTKYFLYTPYTDVIPLNYKCYGKTLTIIMLPALQDCTASIIVQCDGMTIAKQTVSLGSSLAISVENNSEKSTAIVNACSKYLASAGGVIGGAVTGNLPAVAGGAIGVVASTVNVLNAIGNTYIHSYGTTTGTSLSLNPQNIYLIEYIVKTDKPDNFASTVGNLCNKELTLSENMGYTVCDNPKVYGTMTLAERTEIENYLRSGVIL